VSASLGICARDTYHLSTSLSGATYLLFPSYQTVSQNWIDKYSSDNHQTELN